MRTALALHLSQCVVVCCSSHKHPPSHLCSSQAITAQVFGTKYLNAVYGPIMTAWAAAGILGPNVLMWLREREARRVMGEIVASMDPGRFQEHFGITVDQLEEGIRSGIVDLPCVVELADAAHPFLYGSAMNAAAGCMAVGVAALASLRPLPPKKD